MEIVRAKTKWKRTKGLKHLVHPERPLLLQWVRSLLHIATTAVCHHLHTGLYLAITSAPAPDVFVSWVRHTFTNRRDKRPSFILNSNRRGRPLWRALTTEGGHKNRLDSVDNKGGRFYRDRNGRRTSRARFCSPCGQDVGWEPKTSQLMKILGCLVIQTVRRLFVVCISFEYYYNRCSLYTLC